MEEKIREVFLNDLPKWASGANKGKINWIQSTKNKEKVKFIYDDIEGEVEIVDYKPKGQNLYIKYLDKEPFEISTSHFQKCELGKLLNKRTNEFKVEIRQVFKDDNRDLIIIDREIRKDKNGRNWKYYKYHCNKCGWNEGWTEESRLLNGSGCSVCCNPPRLFIHGINDIPTTAPWMIKYFQGGIEEARLYYKSSHEKIFPICYV